MNIWHKTLTQLIIVVMLLGSLAAMVYAGPPAQEEVPPVVVSQDPRPPDDTGNGGGGNDGDGSGGSNDQTTTPTNPNCASLQGQIINWGAGSMGGVATDLKTGSWQISTSSASDGNYGFGGLGVGIATLHINLLPEQSVTFTPHAQDAAIYLNCDYPFIANLALSSGAAVQPPASLEMAAPDNLIPGTNTIVRLVIKNTLPNDISNVIVTNLMPKGFTALNVTTASSSDGNIRIVNGGAEGQLVFVHFNSIPSNMEENILVTVAIDAALAVGSQVKNTATLFYRESVADQTSLNLTIGTAGLPVPAAAPATVTTTLVVEATTPEPTAQPVVTATTALTSSAEAGDDGTDFVPPSGLPTTGDDFLPPPSLLPETGQDMLEIPATLPNTGVSPFIPLGGLILGGLALIVHLVRKV